MKATGIVRRIDDLGRVVIPREIRRTLRIREGDPLEIFIEDGGILFKKYSPVGELTKFVQEYANSLYKTTGRYVFITDTNDVIAVAGVSKKTYLNKPISEKLEKIISTKVYININSTHEMSIIDDAVTLGWNKTIAPIIFEGEAIGSVIIASSTDMFGITEEMLVQTAADFLSQQMEV